jgi:hypothetical protein
LGLLGGIAGGAYCAARPRTKGAWALESAAALCMCTPVYVVALMILLLFGSGLGMVEALAHIPTTYVPLSESPLRWAGALAAPWLVLALPLAGVTLRMMRASMADVLDEDYLRTAMAKGLRPRTVVRRHAVPSAVAPVFTAHHRDDADRGHEPRADRAGVQHPRRLHRHEARDRRGRLRPAVRAHGGGGRLRRGRRPARGPRAELARSARARSCSSDLPSSPR